MMSNRYVVKKILKEFNCTVDPEYGSMSADVVWVECWAFQGRHTHYLDDVEWCIIDTTVIDTVQGNEYGTYTDSTGAKVHYAIKIRVVGYFSDEGVALTVAALLNHADTKTFEELTTMIMESSNETELSGRNSSSESGASAVGG